MDAGTGAVGVCAAADATALDVGSTHASSRELAAINIIESTISHA